MAVCTRSIIKSMTTSQDKYRESLFLLAEGHLVSNVGLFINPLMRSVVICYHLSEHSDLKLQITDELTGALVRNIFLIRGNAGGRAGKNKVLWDGTAFSGMKVAKGQYHLRFVAQQRPVATDQIIRF